MSTQDHYSHSNSGLSNRPYAPSRPGNYLLFLASVNLIAIAMTSAYSLNNQAPFASSNVKRLQQMLQQQLSPDYQQTIYSLADVNTEDEDLIAPIENPGASVEIVGAYGSSDAYGPRPDFPRSEYSSSLANNNLNKYSNRNNYENVNELLQQQQLEQTKRTGRRVSAFVPMRGRRAISFGNHNTNHNLGMLRLLGINDAPSSTNSDQISQTSPKTQQSLIVVSSGNGAPNASSSNVRNGLRNIVTYRNSGSPLLEPAKLRRAFHPMRGKRLSTLNQASNQDTPMLVD